jgi:hypothetical protein
MSLSEHLDRAAAIRRGAVPTRRSPAVGGDFVVLDLTTTQRDDEEPVVDLTDGPAPQRRSTRPNPDEVSPVSALAREQRYEHLSLFGADNQIRAVARTLHRMSVQAPAELPAASSTPAPVVPQPTSRTTVPPTTTAASSDAAQARQPGSPSGPSRGASAGASPRARLGARRPLGTVHCPRARGAGGPLARRGASARASRCVRAALVHRSRGCPFGDAQAATRRTTAQVRRSRASTDLPRLRPHRKDRHRRPHDGAPTHVVPLLLPHVADPHDTNRGTARERSPSGLTPDARYRAIPVDRRASRRRSMTFSRQPRGGRSARTASIRTLSPTSYCPNIVRHWSSERGRNTKLCSRVSPIDALASGEY